MAAKDVRLKAELSLVAVARMSDDDARQFVQLCRWPGTAGQPQCPKCECDAVYHFSARTIFRCKRCETQFSITSGTIFAHHKMKLKEIILGACIFVGGAKGVSALQMSRYHGSQYKTSFVLSHKFREAVQRANLDLGGVVQIDGCTIGGYRVKENYATGKFGKRYARKKFDNRRVVTVARESMGNTRAFVGKSEAASLPSLIKHIDSEAVIQADGSRAWNGLARLFTLMRNNHDFSFSANGVHTNMAESFFGLLRKMQYGIHHKIGAKNLEAYANELAWRQDNRGLSESDRIILLMTLCLAAKPSKKWSGYFQNSKRNGVAACQSTYSDAADEIVAPIAAIVEAA